ncbi:hypothetical protein [Burkholderia vietnamiensis]|uniref:hypothetical protein n=1 Tax=Burkholderia vietnamiensis TaxID=60552 RepID=UPI001D1341CC|nr:hypothetical protein [Burkholderia vietnamiensis]UEC05409.1 hypothetical protein LK462_34950 [Burkholderia vietnamiensis]
MAVEAKGGPGLKATRDAHAFLHEAAAAGLVVDFRTGVIELPKQVLADLLSGERKAALIRSPRVA